MKRGFSRRCIAPIRVWAMGDLQLGLSLDRLRAEIKKENPE